MKKISREQIQKLADFVTQSVTKSQWLSLKKAMDEYLLVRDISGVECPPRVVLWFGGVPSARLWRAVETRVDIILEGRSDIERRRLYMRNYMRRRRAYERAKAAKNETG